MASLISRYLDTVGDGSGTKQQATTAADYLIAPGLHQSFQIHRMIVSYQDTTNWSPTEYANMNIVLPNGITVTVEDTSGILYYLTDEDFPVKQNTDWADLCYDFGLMNFGAGDNVATVRWTFARSGRPVTLNGNAGQKLVVRIRDDLSTLASHRMLVQGYIVKGYQGTGYN